MLLTVRFGIEKHDRAIALLGAEAERCEEFWFGRGLAWTVQGEQSAALHLSLAVDVPRLVARTKRRDRDNRFSVGYCDSYQYSAGGLMAVFLAGLALPVTGIGVRDLKIEIVGYPERPHSGAIAKRLFSPLGYDVTFDNGRLLLGARRSVEKALRELPLLLLALDRRTRLFLSQDELSEIGQRRGEWVPAHPASRALELSFAGRATPLRLLIPGGAAPTTADRTDGDDVIANVAGLSEPIVTGMFPSIKLAPSQATFAAKAFSKMNIDPRWLMYLPSAISSLQGKDRADEMEHPEDAVTYFRDEQVGKVIVEEKHMGSRGIVVLCRTHKTAIERFGISGQIPGCAYTRNGRRFFNDEDTEAVFLERLERALTRARFWERFATDWVCFDGEILPWAVKAAESSEESDLVQTGMLALSETKRALAEGAISASKKTWTEVVDGERAALAKYDAMFKKYRTESANLADLKFAPFHLLAVEGRTFFDCSHLWHMETFSRLARSGDNFLIPTCYQMISTTEPKTWSKVFDWWEELSKNSAEGFVIKPMKFLPKGRRGFAQPAIKCRTREHLRLVYGPQYDTVEMREALVARDARQRRRNKHRRILRQFALSIEAVTRFVQRNSMNAVHQCVLGVLAQEVAPLQKET